MRRAGSRSSSEKVREEEPLEDVALGLVVDKGLVRVLVAVPEAFGVESKLGDSELEGVVPELAAELDSV